MNIKITTLLLAASLPVLLIATGCSKTPSKNTNNQRQAPVVKAPAKNVEAPKKIVKSTSYNEYSEEAVLAANKEGKDVAVFFHSKTCGSCAKLDADLNAKVSNIPSDLVILKADWDDNQELARELNVEKYHTVSFLGDENVTNVKGLFTLEDILAASTLPSNNENEKIIVNSYNEYSEDAVFDAKAKGKDIAVFFHSKTCGSCAKLDTDIDANASNIPSDLVILKADWDDNQALAKELNVEKYHTVSFLGDETTNVKGLFTLEDILAAK